MTNKRNVSPLTVGLLHLLPSLLLLVAVLVILQNVWQLSKENEAAVLGTEFKGTEIKTVTREERINRLEEALKSTDSQVVRREIERLEE